MSTVKVTNLVHPSSSSTNIQLGSDGSVVLPSGFTGGIGTNVVQTVKTDTFTTTSATFTDVTGLAVTITPSSSTSKVLVMCYAPISNTEGNLTAIRLVRGSTVVAVGDAAGSRVQATAIATGAGATVGYIMGSPHISFLDSPATDLAVTYKVEMRRGSGGTATLNRLGSDTDNEARGRTVATITAIEVAA